MDASPSAPHALRLAVLGWNEDARDALHALEETGGYAGVAIGDRSGMALIAARRHTGLPCFQQVHEMLGHVEYDAVLLADPFAATEDTTLAARRGASLIVLSDASDTSVLEAAAEAASVRGLSFALMRPALHAPGAGDFLRLLLDDADWAPHYLDVTVEGPEDPDRLLRRATAYAVAAVGHVDGAARATAWAEPWRALGATVEDAGRQVALHVRHAPEAYLRLAGDSVAGAFAVTHTHGHGYVSLASSPDRRTQYEAPAVDEWAVEAARIAAGDGEADLEAARGQTALLDAITRAIASGEAEATACCVRPALRLIAGGDQPREARTRHLRLVGAPV